MKNNQKKEAIILTPIQRWGIYVDLYEAMYWIGRGVGGIYRGTLNSISRDKILEVISDLQRYVASDYIIYSAKYNFVQDYDKVRKFLTMAKESIEKNLKKLKLLPEFKSNKSLQIGYSDIKFALDYIKRILRMLNSIYKYYEKKGGEIE